jgi:hypothetical protein
MNHKGNNSNICSSNTINYRNTDVNTKSTTSTSNSAGKIIDEKQRALETQQEKLVQKEKLVNKKEKDVKKMELECNDKIQGLASSKAYIATLENQLKELKHSNHVMKVKISAMEITSEKDKENSLPKQPIENQSNPSYNQTCHRCTELNTLKEMDTQYHIRTNSLISTMENKIDLIDRTNKIEIQYLRDRVNKLEMENQIKASIHEKFPNETSRRRNFHANKEHRKQ